MLPKKALSMGKNIYSEREEFLNAGSHACGFLLTLFGVVALMQRADTLMGLVVAIVYGFSLAAMFLSSTLYHMTKKPDLRALLRKIDHTAIYLLIAGTYTPVLLFTVGGSLGTYAAIAIWTIGLVGVGFKLTIGHKYPKLGVATYALMGWFALLLIYPIYQGLSGVGMTLLVLGGVLYSAGIPFYMLKSRHYSHALWHMFVVLGAGVHFFMIYGYIY